MAKTQQELKELKRQLEQLKEDLAGLSTEELEEVIGGRLPGIPGGYLNMPLTREEMDSIRVNITR